MGILLAEPITEALKDALMASAALSEVRRVLEIIVPLAYRPPIKVSMCLTGTMCAPPALTGNRTNACMMQPNASNALQHCSFIFQLPKVGQTS